MSSLLDTLSGFVNERVKQIGTLVLTWLGIILPFFSAVRSFSPGGAAADFGLEPLVTPAPYAFIIWAPIYLGLLALAVYQALPEQENDPQMTALRPWLALTGVLNAFWLTAVARGHVWLPVVIIFAMLAAAFGMRIALGSKQEGAVRWLGLAVSIYAGWLTLATIVNTSSAFLMSGWSEGATFWALVMLLVGAGVGLAVRNGLRDPVYGAVFAWTFLAIAVEAWGDSILVVILAFLLALLFLMTSLPPLLRYRR